MDIQLEDEKLRASVRRVGIGDAERARLVVDCPPREEYWRRVRRALAALVTPEPSEARDEI